MYSRPLPSGEGMAAHRLHQSALGQGTVETSVSNYPKCKDLVVAYGRWSLARIKPQGASSKRSKKRSRHIYCMEDHLLHAILSYAMCSSILLLKFFAYLRLDLKVMYQSIPKPPIPPPRANPGAFDFFKTFWPNSPLCCQFRRSNVWRTFADKNN